MKTPTLYSLTLALLSLFAGGCLTILFIIVPYWFTLSPEAFLQWFTNFGPRVGITMLPMEVAPLVFSIVAYFHAAKYQLRAKRLWLYVNLVNIIILLTFFLYFLPVNFSFLNQTLSLSEVPAELGRWRLMHVLRTALAVGSAGIAAVIVSTPATTKA